MSISLSTVILGQFEAAMGTLRQAIEDCPDGEWSGAHLDGPFSQVAFHVLFFTDIYLGWSEEAVKDQEFHVRHRDIFLDYEELEDRKPLRTYGRDFVRDYFEFCLAKGRRTIPQESDTTMFGESGFSYRKFPRLELHIYSIRHIQHHAAQLGLRNQFSAGKELKWVSSGWREH